jgi:CHAD domain-containing protein
MAYRLPSDESVTQGLRRLARKELRSAREELGKTTPPHDEAIHEARKSLKKVRAIVELIAADDGRGLAGSEKRLRTVHHTLSRLRDADAMLEVLTKLRKMHPRAFDEHTFARMRRRLTAYKQTSMTAAQDDGVWKEIDRALRALRRDATRWRPAHRRFGAIAAGLRASYRDGRKALARATKHQRATDYHEWRKAMKSLWYQLRLIEVCGPAIRADVRALHRAETWLGEDHNAVILCAALSKDAPLCDLEGLRRAANGYQCDLRRKAIAKTARIYGRAPSDFLRRLKRAWNAWKRQRTNAPPRRSSRAAA